MSGAFSFGAVSLGELIATGLNPDSNTVAQSSAANPKEKRDRPLVLVVDGEHVIADTLAVILSKQGYAARPVYTGDDALELANAIAPDLVISHVMTPGINGFELGIKVKELVHDCKVLLFSGHANALVDTPEEVRQRGYDFRLLSKPAPSALVERIEKLDVSATEPAA